MKRFAAAALALAVFALSGCMPSTEIKDTAIIQSMAIDKDEADYVITLQKFSPNKEAGEQKGSSHSELIQGKGSSIAEAMNQIKSELPDLKVSLNTHVAKVSVVGIGMRHAVGVAAKIFQILEENHIEFKQVATSEISISLIVDLDDGKKACQAICAAFDL